MSSIPYLNTDKFELMKHFGLFNFHKFKHYFFFWGTWTYLAWTVHVFDAQYRLLNRMQPLTAARPVGQTNQYTWSCKLSIHVHRPLSWECDNTSSTHGRCTSFLSLSFAIIYFAFAFILITLLQYFIVLYFVLPIVFLTNHIQLKGVSLLVF